MIWLQRGGADTIQKGHHSPSRCKEWPSWDIVIGISKISSFQGNGGGLAFLGLSFRCRYIFCPLSYFAVEEEGEPISLRLTGVRSIDEHPEPQEADDLCVIGDRFLGSF